MARPKRDLKQISVNLPPDLLEHFTAKAQADGMSRNKAAVAAIEQSLVVTDAPPVPAIGDEEEPLALVLPNGLMDKIRSHAEQNGISVEHAAQRGIAEEVGATDAQWVRLRMPIKLWDSIGAHAQNRAGFIVEAIETALKAPEYTPAPSTSDKPGFAVPGPGRQIRG